MSSIVQRYATVEDSAAITRHRHQMFGDNGFAPEAILAEMDLAFEPWVRARLEDGGYLGLLLEDEGRILAGAGVFFAEFPPHWRDPQPLRAYVLNVYTVPEERGKGYAKRLMHSVVEECRKRRVLTLVLHASPQGRPVYEAMGFAETDEMMLRLELPPG